MASRPCGTTSERGLISRCCEPEFWFSLKLDPKALLLLERCEVVCEESMRVRTCARRCVYIITAVFFVSLQGAPGAPRVHQSGRPRGPGAHDRLAKRCPNSSSGRNRKRTPARTDMVVDRHQVNHTLPVHFFGGTHQNVTRTPQSLRSRNSVYVRCALARSSVNFGPFPGVLCYPYSIPFGCTLLYYVRK